METPPSKVTPIDAMISFNFHRPSGASSLKTPDKVGL